MSNCSLSVRSISSGNSRQLRFPFISIGQQLLLVVQKLFSELCSVFCVGGFNDGVHGAALLAHATVNALGHVDVVPSGPPRAVFSLFGLDGDGQGGADSFTELAGDTSLFARGVPS